MHAVRGFLGLAGYYCRFIQNYGQIAASLTWLLQKDGFFWSDEATEAFQALQQALTTAPVLQLPDFDRPFIIECDASGSGFSAILHQGTGPVAFFSCLIARSRRATPSSLRMSRSSSAWCRPYAIGGPISGDVSLSSAWTTKV